MILTSMAATSLANMISCLCVGIEMSTVVLAAAYEISRLYGGWFISPSLMTTFPKWKFADVLSYIKYSFVGVSLNENLHLLINCDTNELSSSGKCVIPPTNTAPYDGAAFNSYYGYDQYTIAGCAGGLIIYIVVCRILAYLGLRFIKV